MKKILLLILITLSITPLVSGAQEYTLLEPLPCIEGTSTDNTCKDGVTKTINLDDYIGYVFKFSIALAAFLAVVMIIWGGVEYMTSETPFGKGNGRERIENAVIGLVMVLASYLILATIDPRLVEIKTSIDPIVINKADLDAVKDFQTQLGNDLRALSAESQSRTNAFVSERSKLQQELDRVNYALQNDQDLDEDQIADLERQKREYEGKIKEVSVEISKNVAASSGQASFARAYDYIKKPDELSAENLKQYTAPVVQNKFFVVGGEYRTAANTKGQANPVTNVIQDQYNTRINQVLKNVSDPAQQIAEIDILEKQRDFYITQVQEEVKLTDEIKKHGSLRVVSGGQWGNVQTTKVDNKPALDKKLAEYQANVNDPQKPLQAGISTGEYVKIMQARVDEINKTLGNVEPPPATTNP
ncbi:MAG: hypothetical protein QG640_46 [Patescibacteria group bacterium]|nr:hypothetical protein [Patescibacteria group bacterium]